MKLKQLGRLSGTINAIIGSYAAGFCYRTISDVNYNFFLRDSPLEQKIIGGAYVGTIALLIPCFALMISDGLFDIINETHHYYGLLAWENLTRSEKKRMEIDSSLAY